MVGILNNVFRRHEQQLNAVFDRQTQSIIMMGRVALRPRQLLSHSSDAPCLSFLFYFSVSDHYYCDYIVMMDDYNDYSGDSITIDDRRQNTDLIMLESCWLVGG